MCSRSGLGPRVHCLCRWCWRRSTELSDPWSYCSCSLPHPYSPLRVEWSTVIILRARNLATQQQVHSYHAQQRPARRRRGHDHARSRVAARHRVEFCGRGRCHVALDLDSPAIPLEARWGAWKSRFSLHDGGTDGAAVSVSSPPRAASSPRTTPSVCPGHRPGPQPVLGPGQHAVSARSAHGQRTVGARSAHGQHTVGTLSAHTALGHNQFSDLTPGEFQTMYVS